MSLASLVEEEYILRRRHQFEEETFNRILFLLGEKYSQEDCRIPLYIRMKSSTIEMIEKEGTWRHDKDGFINRSNFQYEDHKIVYRTNRIGRVNGVYAPVGLGTERAQSFFDENLKAFELLGKIETVLDSFYEAHKEEIDNAYNYCMGNRKLKSAIDPALLKELKPIPYVKRPEIFEEKLNEKVKIAISNTHGLFNAYGGLFIHRVITILNELDSVENLKGYVDKFVKSYGRIVTLLEPNEYNEELMEIARMPYMILRIVDKYSVRGQLFAKMAKQELRKLDGSLSFELETPTTEVQEAPSAPNM